MYVQIYVFIPIFEIFAATEKRKKTLNSFNLIQCQRLIDPVTFHIAMTVLKNGLCSEYISLFVIFKWNFSVFNFVFIQNWLMHEIYGDFRDEWKRIEQKHWTACIRCKIIVCIVVTLKNSGRCYAMKIFFKCQWWRKSKSLPTSSDFNQHFWCDFCFFSLAMLIKIEMFIPEIPSYVHHSSQLAAMSVIRKIRKMKSISVRNISMFGAK